MNVGTLELILRILDAVDRLLVYFSEKRKDLRKRTSDELQAKLDAVDRRDPGGVILGMPDEKSDKD